MSHSADRDLIPIQQDALLMETAARRGDLSAFADEPVAGLLGALAAESDRGGMAPLDRYGPRGLEPPVPVQAAPPRARVSRHTGVVAITVAALLVGSNGIAAAVTGRPFATFSSVASLMTGGHADSPHLRADGSAGDGRGRGEDNQGSAVSASTKKLNLVQPMLAHGDTERARSLLEAALADLQASGSPVPAGLQTRIDKLTDRIDHVAATGGPGAEAAAGDHQTAGKPSSPDGGSGGHGQAKKDPAPGTSGKSSGGSTGSGGAGGSKGSGGADDSAPDPVASAPDKPSGGQGHGKPDAAEAAPASGSSDGQG
jgi:hypothetical protein